MNLPSKKVKGRKVVPRDDGASTPAVPDDERITDLEGYDPAVEVRPRPEPSLLRQIIGGGVQLAICAGLLVGGYFAYQAIIASSPKAERKAPQRVARLVQVTDAIAATQGPQIEGWGEVIAAQTLVVRPEISGTIEWVHPEVTPGGRLEAGMVAARLDTRDLELAITRAEADIADIQARIAIERGQADLGRRDLARTSRNLSDEQRALILREPQMAQLEAELVSARATLQQAKNALDKAEVKVPFDALVMSAPVAPGSMLTQGAEAATLVAADRFHVVLSVPASMLDWIEIDTKPEVRLTQPGVWPEGTYRTGRVVRLDAGLSETGRMAGLIVEVADPMALEPGNTGKPRILMDSFVRGTITGRLADSENASLPDGQAVITLDRTLLRQGDTVWVMDGEDKLDVRDVRVLWRGPETVLVGGGLAPGDRIVTTPLATHAPGMALRVRGAEVSG